MVDIEKIEWEKIKLTIVMPLYNRRDYMEQAINSVLSQDTDFRVLLVIADDASTDGSTECAMDFEKKYPQNILTVFSNENQGLLANDLRVFQHMRSDYFCVLDPDDYWVDDHFLQKAVTFLETHLEYTSYGSNTKRLVDGKLEDGFYIQTSEEESTADGIEDYLEGRAYVVHTTGAVYKNVLFRENVPEIMKDAVGTLAETSFRGDVDRYVMHLKYGKAKFVNNWVGVYRIHDKGICQGSTIFHWILMNARAELDYSRFYENLYFEKFLKRAENSFDIVCKEVYKAALYKKFFYMDDYDKENFAFLMNVLSRNKEHLLTGTMDIDFREEEVKVRRALRNKEKRDLVIWGTGGSMEMLVRKYEIFFADVFCFVDGNGQRVGMELHGKPVISAKGLRDIKNKYVILMSSYHEEILESIKKEEVCSLGDVVNLFWYDRFVANL